MASAGAAVTPTIWSDTLQPATSSQPLASAAFAMVSAVEKVFEVIMNSVLSEGQQASTSFKSDGSILPTK